MKRYRELHKIKIALQARMYNSNCERRMYQRFKSKCKIQKIPFNLELEDIVIPEYCPILGIKLHREGGRKAKNHPDSVSLDRIDPKLGYIKGNVRVISNRANLLKSNAEIWELELVLNDLKSRQ